LKERVDHFFEIGTFVFKILSRGLVRDREREEREAERDSEGGGRQSETERERGGGRRTSLF
jgi:hypothetical protein